MCDTEMHLALRAAVMEQMSHGVACLWRMGCSVLLVLVDVGVGIYHGSRLQQAQAPRGSSLPSSQNSSGGYGGKGRA